MGTTVTLYLPVSAADVLAIAPASAARRAGSVRAC